MQDAELSEYNHFNFLVNIIVILSDVLSFQNVKFDASLKDLLDVFRCVF
jgi:hypothetical protein